MQRQAVPTPRRQTADGVPVWKSRSIARLRCNRVVAKRGGMIDHVDASRIVNKVNEMSCCLSAKAGARHLQPDQIRSKSTEHPVNQRPGDVGRAGDGGRRAGWTVCPPTWVNWRWSNLRVAFMPWNGYKLRRLDPGERTRGSRKIALATIHIQNPAYLRDTKLVREEITTDIPNIR